MVVSIDGGGDGWLTYPGQTPAIILTASNDKYYYKVWAHEIGHALGYILLNSKRNSNQLLWDLYDGGFIKDQDGQRYENQGDVSTKRDIMSGPYSDNPPSQMSSMSRYLLGFMNSKIIGFGDTKILTAIEKRYLLSSCRKSDKHSTAVDFISIFFDRRT